LIIVVKMAKKTPVTIDVKDRKILQQLDINARQSFSEIGKKVKMPKNVVAYRVNNLVDAGIIKGFYTVINVARLGYMYVRLLLKLQNTSEEDEKKIVQFFKEKKEVSWLAKVGEGWDLAVVVLEKDLMQLKALYKELLYRFSDKIAEKEISIATEVYHFKNKFLYDAIDPSYSIVGGSLGGAEVDKLDIALLNELSRNARIPTMELAKKLRVTPKTVIARMKRLIKDKIILEFRCNVDYELLGYQYSHISFMLSAHSKEKEKIFFHILASHPTVLYITKSLSRRDIEFEFLTKNPYESHRLLAQLMRQLGLPVREVEVIQVYEIYDIKYSIRAD
jgi:DNA-binding Lrp family transcriptional regulator